MITWLCGQFLDPVLSHHISSDVFWLSSYIWSLREVWCLNFLRQHFSFFFFFGYCLDTFKIFFPMSLKFKTFPRCIWLGFAFLLLFLELGSPVRSAPSNHFPDPSDWLKCSALVRDWVWCLQRCLWSCSPLRDSGQHLGIIPNTSPSPSAHLPFSNPGSSFITVSRPCLDSNYQTIV
jgi:hypothetical protein